MKTELVTTLKRQATKLLKELREEKGNGIDHLTRETATAYGTEPVFLEGLDHDMMLGPAGKWRWTVFWVGGYIRFILVRYAIHYSKRK